MRWERKLFKDKALKSKKQSQQSLYQRLAAKLHIQGRPMWLLVIVLFASFISRNRDLQPQQVTYYIDSKAGNDQNDGTSKKAPWKSFSRLYTVQLQPGDSVCLKRGSSFIGPLEIRSTGTAENYITITD